MFCPKCGAQLPDSSAFCTSCGAPVAGAQPSAPVGRPVAALAPKKGIPKAVVVVVIVAVLVLVAGLATNWFGFGGVQPKEAVEVPAASQQAPAASGGGADAPSSAGQGSDSAGDGQQADGAVRSAVEAYTWDELSQISAQIAAAGDEAAAIEVAKRYNLCTPEGKLDGTQVKSVTLPDGTQTYVQIAGFAHDDRTDGGKAGITFIFGDCINKSNMNPTNTNAGGWEKCQMRLAGMRAYLGWLPEDLASVIVPVDKLTNNVGETDSVSSVSATSDSLWLFSWAEVAGTGTEFNKSISGDPAYGDVLDAEGSQYQLFRDTEDDSEGYVNAFLKSLKGEPTSWWMRSPNPGGSDYVRFAYYDEGDVEDRADDYFGVVPGFCV